MNGDYHRVLVYLDDPSIVPTVDSTALPGHFHWQDTCTPPNSPQPWGWIWGSLSPGPIPLGGLVGTLDKREITRVSGSLCLN